MRAAFAAMRRGDGLVFAAVTRHIPAKSDPTFLALSPRDSHPLKAFGLRGKSIRLPVTAPFADRARFPSPQGERDQG